jgi:hypothetical protein
MLCSFKLLLDLQRLHKKVISSQNVSAMNIKRTYAVNILVNPGKGNHEDDG